MIIIEIRRAEELTRDAAPPERGGENTGRGNRDGWAIYTMIYTTRLYNIQILG